MMHAFSFVYFFNVEITLKSIMMALDTAYVCRARRWIFEMWGFFTDVSIFTNPHTLIQTNHSQLSNISI